MTVCGKVFPALLEQRERSASNILYFEALRRVALRKKHLLGDRFLALQGRLRQIAVSRCRVVFVLLSLSFFFVAPTPRQLYISFLRKRPQETAFFRQG